MGTVKGSPTISIRLFVAKLRIKSEKADA